MQICYRDILKQTFRDRTTANPGYSLRAFARDLEISPSTLSSVLNCKQGLSGKKAAELARRIRLPEWQIELFCDSVAAQHAKAPSVRRLASARLKKKKSTHNLRLLEQAAIRSLCSWLDLAILELIHFADFKPHHNWIAKRLGVETAQVDLAVERLLISKLLEIDEKTGKWIDTTPAFTTTDGIPNQAIRNLQRSLLQIFLDKLQTEDVNSRTAKSVVFSMANEKVPLAKAIIDEAIAKIVSLAEDPEQAKDDVFCFSAQFFSLLTKGNIK